MSEPSDAERMALAEAGPLLRFASESVKDLDISLPIAIAEAREVMQQNAWTPQSSQSFWTAFNKLCQLIKPVTMSSIAAKHANIDTWKLFPPHKEKLSLAARSSGRYLAVLFALIAVTLPLQLYAWIFSIESKKADDLISNLQATATTVGDSYTKLNAETGGLVRVGPSRELGGREISD
jgi:hypothetical protein